MTRFESILVPIPKDRKKSMNVSSNYRSIAISSIVGKCLDNVILSQHALVLSTSHLQFGFKPGHSTSQCTYVVNEVIDFYAQNGSSVYVTLLDASKAFDKVHFGKLFRMLIKKKLCPAVTLLLLSMYTCQSLIVSWQGVRSENFDCKNGVKQGGVMSPILFCIYIEELLVQLEQSRIGCHLGHSFAGAVAYADDVCLMAPCLSAMQKLLDICSHFADSFCLSFNASKSKAIVCNDQAHSNSPFLLLGENPIPYVSHAIHLGHYIGKDASKCNSNKIVRDMIVRTNSICSNYRFVDTNVMQLLFTSHCTSFYGYQFVDLSECGIQSLDVAWKKCIRRLFKLPPRTRSQYVYHLMNYRPEPRVQLLSRLANFFHHCFTSTNPLVRTCSVFSQCGFSVVDNNLRELLSYCKIDYDIYNSENDSTDMSRLVEANWAAAADPEILSTSQAIMELCMMRDGVLDSSLNNDEISQLLSFVCLN
jgi:hypothetical protein